MSLRGGAWTMLAGLIGALLLLWAPPGSGREPQTSQESRSANGRIVMLTNSQRRDDGGFESIFRNMAAEYEALYGLKIVNRSPKASTPAALKALLQDVLKAGYGHIIFLGSGYPLDPALYAAHPDRRFYFISMQAPDLPNAAGYHISLAEPAFLAGALAARKSETGHVAFLGGRRLPVIHTLFCAFASGARYVAPDIQVDVSVLGTFNDRALAYRGAQALLARGADVILHGTGAGGPAVFRAAREQGGYAIGVDENQNGEAPGTVLASVVKKTEVLLFSLLDDIRNDRFSGGMHVFTIRDGSAALVFDQHSSISVPEDMEAAIVDLEFEVRAGLIPRHALRPPNCALPAEDGPVALGSGVLDAR
ncbi:BMP family lipoprotein [Yunchengibacter salinarum]|uniref:BMP family lipoprotein n=1 Tax=Yunchengibacter salinarum TaxID=3133399 RepID=UPI0035B5F7AD